MIYIAFAIILVQFYVIGWYRDKLHHQSFYINLLETEMELERTRPKKKGIK